MAPLRFETNASAFLPTLSICFRALMTRRASFLPEPVVRAARRGFCALVSFLRISADSLESSGSPGPPGPSVAGGGGGGGGEAVGRGGARGERAGGGGGAGRDGGRGAPPGRERGRRAPA